MDILFFFLSIDLLILISPFFLVHLSPSPCHHDGIPKSRVLHSSRQPLSLSFYPLPRSSANMHFIIMCSYRNKSRFESLFKSVVIFPVAEAPRTLVELIGLVLWYRVTLMITIELRVLRAVNAC